jgi:hypothetical protein
MHRLRDNVEKCGGARGATNDVTVWRIHVACGISKATCTRTYTPTRSCAYTYARMHTQTDIYYCFSTAKMIHRHASMLRYTYIGCLVQRRAKSHMVWGLVNTMAVAWVRFVFLPRIAALSAIWLGALLWCRTHHVSSHIICSSVRIAFADPY